MSGTSFGGPVEVPLIGHASHIYRLHFKVLRGVKEAAQSK